MKKRIFTLSICAVMVFSLCSTAYAFDSHDYSEFGDESMLSEIPAYEEVDIDQLMDNIIDKYVTSDDLRSQRDYTVAESIISSFDAITESSISLTPRSGYDENKAKLREANYLELILNLDEGLSNYENTVVLSKSLGAKNTSETNYPNDSGKQDACRHFTWAYDMTQPLLGGSILGKLKARTAGNNHEWGLKLLSPCENYFDKQYSSYINSGKDESAAARQALYDVTMDVGNLKYDTVSALQSSFSVFKSFFDKETIMDFVNNCYGRAYGETGSFTASLSSFKDSMGKGGEVITNYKDVTDDDYNRVWAWDWYSY